MATKSRETNVLVPIVGGFWVAGSVAISFVQVVLERRDVVISGVLDGSRLSVSHRETILTNDWIPLVVVSALSCLVLAAFFVVVPFALGLNRYYKILCFICAAVPSIGVVGFLESGIAEYDMMQSILANETSAGAASAG